jgi:transcription elongation factor Elf1
MNMIALAPIQNCKQSFECLRCGHQESRRIEVTNKPMLAVG